MYVCVLVAQSCLSLCDCMDCSPPGSSVHWILQVRTLEWVAISFSRGIFPTQGSNLGLLHCKQMLYPLNHQGSPMRHLEVVKFTIRQCNDGRWVSREGGMSGLINHLMGTELQFGKMKSSVDGLQ